MILSNIQESIDSEKTIAAINLGHPTKMIFVSTTISYLEGTYIYDTSKYIWHDVP